MTSFPIPVRFRRRAGGEYVGPAGTKVSGMVGVAGGGVTDAGMNSLAKQSQLQQQALDFSKTIEEGLAELSELQAFDAWSSAIVRSLSKALADW